MTQPAVDYFDFCCWPLLTAVQQKTSDAEYFDRHGEEGSLKTWLFQRVKSPNRRNMRRAHDALVADAYVEDKVTGELHRPHHIDLNGMYRGKQFLKVKDRI